MHLAHTESSHTFLPPQNSLATLRRKQTVVVCVYFSISHVGCRTEFSPLLCYFVPPPPPHPQSLINFVDCFSLCKVISCVVHTPRYCRTTVVLLFVDFFDLGVVFYPASCFSELKAKKDAPVRLILGILVVARFSRMLCGIPLFCSTLHTLLAVFS